MHVQNMLHKIKAPKDCSIGTQPQPVPDSNLGQVQSLATWFAAVAAEDGTTQDSITARVNQTFKLQKIAWLHDPFSFDSLESRRIMPSIKECRPVVVNVIRESGVCLQSSRRWQAGACMQMEWVVGCCYSVCEGALVGYLMLCCDWPEAAKVRTVRRTHCKHRQKLEWALLGWDCQWQMWIRNSWLKNWFWISRAAVAEHWSLLLQHHLLLLLAASVAAAAAEPHWGHGHNWQRRSS